MLMESREHAICTSLSVLFLYAPAYRVSHFEKLIFELKVSSYIFKILCILLREVIPLKKMVPSSAKFTNLISLSRICIPLIFLLALMKLANISAAIMYNNIESGHPLQTPSISVKKSARRPFILVLDRMFVYAILLM